MTDEQQLEAAVLNLRNRIRSAPPNSYTARETAAWLDRLDSPPDLYPTAAAKLAAVREAARELTHGLKYVDPVRHGPNLGPSANPRPPRRK